jgi:hypothetical protein
MDMALSAHFGKSFQMHWEHDSLSEERTSGCVLANLLSQSLALYVEVEKTHWHLRLNPAGDAVNSESGGPAEMARDLCATSLRLVASISRLQRVLDPNFSPECAALLAAVEEKIAENCALASERQYGPQEHTATLVFQGPNTVERTFRDTRLSPGSTPQTGSTIRNESERIGHQWHAQFSS